MGEEQDSWLEGIGVDISGVVDSVVETVQETATSAVETVQETATTVVETVQETATTVVETADETVTTVVQTVDETVTTVGGFVDDVVEKVEETVDDVVETVDDTVDDVVETVEETVDDVVETVEETVDDVVETVEETVDDVVETVEETVDDVVETVEETVDDVIETVEETVDDVIETVEEFVDDVVETVEKIELPQDPVMKALEDAASEGHPVAPRALSSDELADAKAIFGSSLDYSKIVVDGGSVESLGASRTIGNAIHLTHDLFVPGTSDTTTHGKRILVHELTHVWQYQHQGWTYAPEALWAQLKAAVTGGDAYDWRPLDKKGTPWEDWNPEAQAEAVEDYNKALHNVKDGKATKQDYDDLAVLKKYVDSLVAGPT